MITGFQFKDENGETWWEKRKNLPAYYWIFNDYNGSGICITFTYTSR